MFLAGIINLVVWTIMAAKVAMDNDFRREDDKRPLPNKRPIYVALVLLAITAFIPSKQEMYAMGAATQLESVASNPQVHAIASNSLKVVEKMMSDYLNDEKAK